MPRPASIRWGVVGALVVLLAGCRGTLSGTVPQTALMEDREHQASGSWMLPEAKSEDLLYITNYSTVLVYSYPQGKFVGELKGFVSAAGACVDSKGDVFIANFKPVTVYEYAHGGAKRIGSFPTKKAGTTGCAINPVNGDLAISGVTSYLEIYKGAAGKPVVLHDKNMFFGQFCTYDSSGNLFFAGLKDPSDHLQLSELAAGSKTFISVKPNQRFEPEVSIQWSGQYLTALSYVPWPRGKPTIFQYSISSNRATKVGSTPLDGPADSIVEYFINAQTLVVPGGSPKSGSSVRFYSYPAGGEPFQTITKHLTDPRGVVVSLAQNR
jgi:hypothetical protein